jgi:hypothetical protein
MGNLFQQTEVVAAIVGAIVGGIIGIVGSVITIIVSHILRSNGKVKLFSNRTKVAFYRNNAGVQEKLENPSLMEDMELAIDVDIYNGSDMPRILGDFKVELFEKKVKKIFETEERTASTGGFLPWVMIPTTTHTIYPRDSETLKCYVYLKPLDLTSLKNIDRVILTARYPDQKKFRAQVSAKIDLTANHNEKPETKN